MKKKQQELLESLIGLHKEQAVQLCKENGYTFRITRDDCIYYIITCDFEFNRINLEIDNGVVTKTDIG